MFIIESAFKDKDLFTTPVLVGIKLRVRRPLHKRDILALILVKRHHSQPLYQALMPRLSFSVEDELPFILFAELVELNKNRGTFCADNWLMAGAY